jgi:hypothetical protein
MTVPLAIAGCPGTAEATHQAPPHTTIYLSANGAVCCHVTSRPHPRGHPDHQIRLLWGTGWHPGAGESTAPKFNPHRRSRRPSRASCRRVHRHRRPLVGRSSGWVVPTTRRVPKERSPTHRTSPCHALLNSGDRMKTNLFLFHLLPHSIII